MFRSTYAANRVYFHADMWSGEVYEDGRHIQNKELLAWLNAKDPEDLAELPFEPYVPKPLAWNCCRGGDIGHLDIFSQLLRTAMVFGRAPEVEVTVTKVVLTADAPPRGPPAS